MSKGDEQAPDPERPWLDRIELPKKLPTTLSEAGSELNELREIRAHREWVIDGLRAHIENIEHDLRHSRAHVENLDKRLKDLSKHVDNLEIESAKREAYLDELETHIVNLERRINRRAVEFEGEGIFPSSRYPRLQAIYDLGEEIRGERRDLQRRFPENRAADFWYWLMWHGHGSHPSVAEQRYPEPDAFLRERVVGEATESEQYARSGLVDWWTVDGCLRAAGFDPLRGSRVLDFGVGCGRILQYVALYSESCELAGADVDTEAIEWCRANLDFASFEVLPKVPPSPFPAGHFDAVYAFSVFSHLSEPLHRGWLEDLYRITKPGAAVVLTVQGRRVAESVLDGSWSGAFPDAAALRKAMPTFEQTGFVFFPYQKLGYTSVENAQLGKTLDLQSYGSTFILESYVRECWSEFFDIVRYDEHPDEWQDYAVMRRKD